MERKRKEPECTDLTIGEIEKTRENFRAIIERGIKEGCIPEDITDEEIEKILDDVMAEIFNNLPENE